MAGTWIDSAVVLKSTAGHSALVVVVAELVKRVRYNRKTWIQPVGEGTARLGRLPCAVTPPLAGVKRPHGPAEVSADYESVALGLCV